MPRSVGRRSRAATSQAGDTLAIPPSLLELDTLPRARSGAAKRVKREHEYGPFKTIRRKRGGDVIAPSELLGEWQELLLPRAGSVTGDEVGREARALRAAARLPDLPPLYIGACAGSDTAQELLTAALRKAIEDEDWQELWVLFGQISAWLQDLATPGAVQPWWMQQARSAAGSSEVAEVVDLAAREEPGCSEDPIDVEAQVGCAEQGLRRGRSRTSATKSREAEAGAEVEAPEVVELTDGDDDLDGDATDKRQAARPKKRDRASSSGEIAVADPLSDPFARGLVWEMAYEFFYLSGDGRVLRDAMPGQTLTMLETNSRGATKMEFASSKFAHTGSGTWLYGPGDAFNLDPDHEKVHLMPVNGGEILGHSSWEDLYKEHGGHDYGYDKVDFQYLAPPRSSVIRELKMMISGSYDDWNEYMEDDWVNGPAEYFARHPLGETEGLLVFMWETSLGMEWHDWGSHNLHLNLNDGTHNKDVSHKIFRLRREVATGEP